MKEKKKREFPDVYALLFCMCLVAMIATWIVPAVHLSAWQTGTSTR